MKKYSIKDSLDWNCWYFQKYLKSTKFSKVWKIHFNSSAYIRAEQPRVFELHLRQFLSKIFTRCPENRGKEIDQKNTILIKSCGTTRWTYKKIGKEISKHGSMNIGLNKHCLIKIDNNYCYALDELFAYSVKTLSQEIGTNLNEEGRSFPSRLGLKC